MSKMTLVNQTSFPAMFVVRRGEQVIARLPALYPNASMQIPTADDLEVVATTVVEGNRYASGQVRVAGGADLLARITRHALQGAHELQLIADPDPTAGRIVMRTTTAGPVTFQLLMNGRPMQAVTVRDESDVQSLPIDATYAVLAVINGVTTEVLTTHDPSATIVALLDTSGEVAGGFMLQAH